ncbi:MAG: ABC transporter permease subunit [Mollicutes bacterium PWAP]|nr:ABC transporter permease subunit [Mollicutes bacterium PWAP]
MFKSEGSFKNFNNYKVVSINGQVVKKKNPWLITILALIITALIISIIFVIKPGFTSNLKSFGDSFKKLFNYENIRIGRADISITDTVIKTLNLLGETILFSVLGVVVGIIFSIPLALLSSKSIVKKLYIYMPFRIIMSIIRAIPVLIYAFILFELFSPTLTATITISIFVMTLMSKWLYEELDSVDLSSLDAMDAAGNQKIRGTLRSIAPYLSRSILSYGVYAFEITIRFSAILGLVGIQSVGLLISSDYQNSSRWGHLGIVLIILIFTIILIECIALGFKKFVIEKREKQIEFDSNRNLWILKKQVEMQKSKFWIVKFVLLLCLIFIIILSLINTEWRMASQIKQQLFKNSISDIFNPDFGQFILPKKQNVIYLAGIGISISIGAVVIGLIFSIPLGLLASKNVSGKYFSWIFRIILISIRSIPAFTYGILFFSLTGNHIEFAGALALGIHSIGMLGKLTYEKIDDIDISSKEALETMGNSKGIITTRSLLAQVMPIILSNALYRVEMNFKSLIEIGAIGACVFGANVIMFATDLRLYHELGAYILVIIAVVLILEQISNLGRNKLIKGRFLSKDNTISKIILRTKKMKAMLYSESFNLHKILTEEKIKYNIYVGKKVRKINESYNEIYLKNKSLVEKEIESLIKNKKINKKSAQLTIMQKYGY